MNETTCFITIIHSHHITSSIIHHKNQWKSKKSFEKRNLKKIQSVQIFHTTVTNVKHSRDVCQHIKIIFGFSFRTTTLSLGMVKSRFSFRTTTLSFGMVKSRFSFWDNDALLENGHQLLGLLLRIGQIVWRI